MHMPYSRARLHLHPRFGRLLPRRTVRWHINEDGERSDRVPESEGLYRVLVLGGSATACGVLDHHETWAAQLQGILSTPDALAQLGASTVHVGLVARSQVDSRELEMLTDTLLPHYGRLDLIVVMNGTSDALRWLEAGAPSGEVPDPFKAGVHLDLSREHTYTWRHPALVHFLLKPVVARFRIEERPNVGKLIVSETDARNGVTELTPLRSDASSMYSMFEQTMTRVIAKLRASAPNVLIVRQPWLDCKHLAKDDEQHLWCGRIGKAGTVPAKFVSHADLADLCRGLDDRLVRICTKAGVQCIDVMPALAGPLGTYFYDHFHFTPEGARVVAATIARAILLPGKAEV